MSDASPTDIVNLGVSIIGAAQGNVPFIEDLDAPAADPEADRILAWCQRLYPRCRDFIEQAHDWPECLKYLVPAAAFSDADAEKAPGWEHWYPKPECLALRGVVDATYLDTTRGTEKVYPHIEVAQQIGCNELAENIRFKSIVQLVDTAKMTEPLITVIAHRFAYYLARAIGLEQGVKTDILKEYAVAWNEAKGSSQRRIFVYGDKAQHTDRAHSGRVFT